jgi:hypothetical protein
LTNYTSIFLPWLADARVDYFFTIVLVSKKYIQFISRKDAVDTRDHLLGENENTQKCLKGGSVTRQFLLCFTLKPIFS